ncbi:MAG: alpha/beta hydrolase fold domain-containing protein [Isosphaeraceae bacterium]
MRRLANLTYPSENGRKLAGPLPARRQGARGRAARNPRPPRGRWRRYSKEEFGPRAATFARYGYVVVAPNYTLSAPGRASWPANFQDVQASVRWIRANASKYSIDPGRIAAVGESAGAHLAELLGARSDRSNRSGSNVRAVVALAGPSDLTTLGRESLQGAGLAVSQMVGGSEARFPQLYREASPVYRVTASSAPMMLIHGIYDQLVPPAQSDELERALMAVGVDSERIAVPAAHALTFQVGGRNLVPPILAFLKRTLA